MRFVSLPARNLLRRPQRSAFAAVGIALAVGIYVAMSVLFGGVASQWKTGLAAAGIHAVILQDRQVDWLASSVPEPLIAEVAALPGVRAAEGELLSFLTSRDGTPVLVAGWAPDSVLWSRLDMVAGSAPPARSHDAIAGAQLLRALELAPGERIALDGLAVEIAGRFQTSDPLMGGRLILHLGTLQRQMFREGTVTVVHVVLDDPRDAAALDRVAGHVRAGYPSLAVRPLERLSQDNLILSLLEILRVVVVWTVALAGLAGIANIMLMAANERGAEIGLLVAIGWSPARILSLFVIEALILATFAGLIGLGLGWAIIEGVGRNATLAAFLSDAISPAVLLQALLLAVGIGALAGIAPALRVLSNPADRALRGM